MNSTTFAISLLIGLLFPMTEGGVIKPPKCRCIDTQITPIHPERIQKLVTIAPGPHCKRLQVIATVKFEKWSVKKEIETCVNPEDDWVKEAIKKMGVLK
ncbi:alveolar macrophage chemotactic factor-like [Hoplias malabaricus]|uniref:alveolar macrophage chemotactic factor-like n=1 Tax=Hoplias malabaricus TaxID=27720 RepID=UPI003462AB5B